MWRPWRREHMTGRELAEWIRKASGWGGGMQAPRQVVEEIKLLIKRTAEARHSDEDFGAWRPEEAPIVLTPAERQHLPEPSAFVKRKEEFVCVSCGKAPVAPGGSEACFGCEVIWTAVRQLGRLEHARKMAEEREEAKERARRGEVPEPETLDMREITKTDGSEVK